MATILDGIISQQGGMMDTVKLAYERVMECLGTAGAFYGKTFVLNEVRFDLTGTTAGMFMARPAENLQIIRLNRLFLHTETESMLSDTIPHEVAHLVAYQLWGQKQGHGPKWKAIMKECFGLAPTRCHDMDVSSVADMPYVYKCVCRDFPLSKRMHNNLQKGSIKICKSCRHPITFSHMNSVQKLQLTMKRLFVGASAGGLDRSDMAKVRSLIGDHLVETLIVPPSIAGVRSSLARALGIKDSCCITHPRQDTLPSGLSHAILMSKADDSRMQSAARVLRERGVKVRLIAQL